jgi:hypothetical protein
VAYYRDVHALASATDADRKRSAKMQQRLAQLDAVKKH